MTPEERKRTPEERAAARKEKCRLEARRYYATHRKRILAEKRAKYAADPACRGQAMAYYFANHEREKAKRRASTKRYSAAHPERVRAKDTNYRAQRRAWRVANPAKMGTYARRRRARKAMAPRNDLTHAQWLEIQAAQGHRCWYCGKRRKGKLTQDHIVPLSKGGSHTLHNVIGACALCNSRKGTKPPPVAVQPLLLSLAPAKPFQRRKAS